MKTKITLLCTISFLIVTSVCVRNLLAQTVAPDLIGMAQYGGIDGNGTIFKINPDGTELRSLFKFEGPNGRIPYNSLIQATNGSLYGMTGTGGIYTWGVIFKIKADGTGQTVLHHFDYQSGKYPAGALIQATDGGLYGMTNQGGFFGYGTAFRINPDGSGFTIIHHFDNTNGGLGYGSLIQAKDGLLYGMTLGGPTGSGVVFKMKLDGAQYKVLRTFDTTLGGAFGSLIQATNGSLYGFLGYGGNGGGGAIFRINTDGSAFSVVHDFFDHEGTRPQGSLVQGPNGNIYGVTYDGGSNNYGTIISIKPDGTNFTVLHHFDFTNGAHSTCRLMVYNNHLYGFTSQGGVNNLGVVFKYNLATGEYSNIAEFTHDTGEWPWYGSLLLVHPPASIQTPAEQAHTITFSNVLAKSMTVSFIPGNGSNHLAVMRAGSPPTFQPLDNTNYSGGLGNSQTVVYNGTGSSFEISGLLPDREYYIKIFDYNTNNTGITKYLVANAPVASRHTRTAHEKFFGMASSGGRSLGGTIFQFDPDNTTAPSAIYNFKNITGMNPYGSVTEGRDGFLYGMTKVGTINTAFGTIFRISPDGTNHKILRQLNSTDGIYPEGSLIQASNRMLYGYAQSGGPGVGGTLYRLNTDGTSFKVIHSFTSAGVFAPTGTPLQASNGALYGTTRAGGINGAGGVYRINFDGSGFKVLHYFNKEHERYTYGSLIQGADGFLYGMTNGASSETPGSIFKISMDGASFKTLYKFNDFANGMPEGSLVQVPDGTLYGMVVGDGTNTSPRGFGNIFKIKPDGTGYSIVHYFNGSNGSNPKGSLTLYNSKLYGFTTYGGANNSGVIFNYDLVTASYKKLYDLSRPTGTNPWYGKLILVDAPDLQLNYVTYPANKAVNLPLKLDVTANLVAGAATYTIELNPDPAFGQSTAIQSTGGRKQTFSNLTMGTIYYNRVKTNVTPNWGDTREFSTGDMLTIAYIISPFHNKTNVSWAPVVEVNPIQGATSYTVQLSSDPGFGNSIVRMGSTTKFNFTGLQMDTKYYARVKTNLVDNFGPLRSFTTGNASSLAYVIGPGNNATSVNTTINVTSNPVPTATSYTIQLSETSNFSTVAFQSTSSSARISFSNLKYKTTYYNRVRTNLTSVFGQVRSFTTRTPESIAYVTAPADKATNVQPSSLYITSNPVPGASTFTIQLSETSNFSTIAFQLKGYSRTLFFNGLKYNTVYYNRVLTNLTNVYGAVRSFTTMDAAGILANIEAAQIDAEHSAKEFQVNVHPNPFRDKLVVYIESPTEEAGVILIDSNGKVLFQSLEKTNYGTELSTQVPTGVYFLRINIGMASKVVKVVKIED